MKKNEFIKRVGWKRLIPVSVSLVILLGMTAVFANDWRRLTVRGADMPPVIDFSWTPLGEVDLREFRGYLTMTDDYALDFTSYRLEVVETGREFDLPIDGMIGQEYETPISLGLLANDPEIATRDQITLKFSISDDRGQSSELERIIRLKPQTATAPTITLE